jgi:hypothetical protein
LSNGSGEAGVSDLGFGWVVFACEFVDDVGVGGEGDGGGVAGLAGDFDDGEAFVDEE